MPNHNDSTAYTNQRKASFSVNSHAPAIKFKNETTRLTHELFWRAPMEEMDRSASAAGFFGKNARVLDIGYNVGHSAVWLMLATGSEEVHAVDVTRHHASSLRQLLCEVNPDTNGHPVQALATFLPYQDDLFDAVFCRSVLQYVDMEKTITEIRRVLKPGGTGYIIANMADNPIVNLYRKATVRQRSIPFGNIQEYLSYRKLREWTREGWCLRHKEYHLFTPLFFPVLNRMTFVPAKNCLFYIALFVETVFKKVFPFFARFAWQAYFEIKK